MKVVTMAEFQRNASGFVRDMNEEQEPFVLTRHGRMMAVVTPLPDGVEAELAALYLKKHPTSEAIKADEERRR